jgi:hypothetical protein
MALTPAINSERGEDIKAYSVEKKGFNVKTQRESERRKDILQETLHLLYRILAVFNPLGVLAVQRLSCCP